MTERRHEWVAAVRPAHAAASTGIASFSCPNCRVYAHQYFRALFHRSVSGEVPTYTPDQRFATSECSNCRHTLVWMNDRILYPATTSVDPPNRDLPDHVRETYEEAAAVLDQSPRAAAALMRLAVQELCVALGETGGLNEAIGSMVRKGLSTTVQQALDVVRVIGNSAVHPGAIDLRDDRATAATLFALVNQIGEDLLTRPRETREQFERLPPSIREAIERRDSHASRANVTGTMAPAATTTLPPDNTA